MPDFNFKSGSFPISDVITAAQRKAQIEEQSKQAGNESLVKGMQAIGQVGQSLVDKRMKVAQALALGKQFGIDEEQAKLMTPEQVLDVGKATQPIALPYLDKDGQIQIKMVPRGSKGLPAAPNANATKPQQSQYTLPDGTPTYWDPVTKSYLPANVPGGGVVLKKGDESAVSDATLLTNQIPNIKPMFDAYRTSKSPRLQATPLGRLMNPEGKQAENALKLAAFSFGGKNLTTNEKEVVYGALFPSVTDNAASLGLKEKLLGEFMTGKVDLYQAANLLGPAGAPLKSMLAAKMAQQGQTAPQATTPQSSTQGEPKPTPNPDLAHLSTADLQKLREQMTAHKPKPK